MAKTTAAEPSRGQIDQPLPTKPAPVLAVTLPPNLKAHSRYQTQACGLSKVVLEPWLSLIAGH